MIRHPPREAQRRTVSPTAKDGGDGHYFICPHCHAELDPDARVCPECGSDDETGWAEHADKWGADIPTGYSTDDEFDYEDFIRREFPSGPARILGLNKGIFWLLAAGLAAIALLVFLLLTS